MAVKYNSIVPCMSVSPYRSPCIKRFGHKEPHLSQEYEHERATKSDGTKRRDEWFYHRNDKMEYGCFTT